MATRASKPLLLTQEERETLERWARQATAEYRLVRRSRILLLLAAGISAREVGRALLTSRNTVNVWRQRCETEGIECIRTDRPGRGRRKRNE